MACAPALREGSPPEKVPYREKIGPYLVKKEFDEEGGGKIASVEVQIDIRQILGNQSGAQVVCEISYIDGTSDYLSDYVISNAQFQEKFVYASEKTIQQVWVYSKDTGPIIQYGVFSDDGNGLQIIKPGEHLTIQLSEVADNLTSGMDTPNEWGLFITNGPVAGEDLPGVQAYHFGARMYDPVIARWLGVDPAAQFWNTYAYTGNGFNPLIGVDPDGMEVIVYSREVGVGDHRHLFAQATTATGSKVHSLRIPSKSTAIMGGKGVSFNDNPTDKEIMDPKNPQSKRILQTKIANRNGIPEEQFDKDFVKYAGVSQKWFTKYKGYPNLGTNHLGLAPNSNTYIAMGVFFAGGDLPQFDNATAQNYFWENSGNLAELAEFVDYLIRNGMVDESTGEIMEMRLEKAKKKQERREYDEMQEKAAKGDVSEVVDQMNEIVDFGQ